ncbi:MAG: D-alanine--D-alanine ligase, partial [Synergistales bacterium]|nr:D-alanine--D-alanine ligase [Synergistales bacterium]
MRVVVVHQEVTPEAPEDERDVLTQAQAVAEALRELGHEALVVSAGTTPADLRTRMSELRPEVVFNLVESLFDSDRFQYLAARVLEELGVPFTGNGSRALLVTGDKRL